VPDDRLTLTLCQVRESVAQALRVAPEELDDDRDLFEQGLDSVLLIGLVGRWRARGSAIRFGELAEEPVLRRWAGLLAAADGAVDAVPAPVPPPSGAAEFPLTTMQHAYWTGRQDGQPLGGVAAHFYVELDGEGIDPERLERALRLLVARHGMLRASFDEEGRQRIAPPGSESAGARLLVRDLRFVSEREAETGLDRLRDEYTHGSRDVAAGEVLQVALTLLRSGRTRLHLDLDMLAADALSLRVLLRDLRRLYEDSDALPAVPSLDFAAYCAAHAVSLADERERARRWWVERLADLPSAPELPYAVDPLRPIARADSALTRSRRLHHWLDPEAKAALLDKARTRGLTPAAVLATAFAEAIAAWSGSRRFLINLPVFDREPLCSDVGDLIGDFSSSLLLDADLREEVDFAGQAHRIQVEIRRGVAHAAYSGVDVLRDLARLQGRPVLAPIVYTSAIGLGEIFEPEVRRVFGEPAHIISQGPQVALDAQVTELDGGLLLNWDVREGLFEPGVAQAAFAAYRDLVDRLAAGDDGVWDSPASIPTRDAAVATRSRSPWPDDEQPGYALHERFFAIAAREPEREAVVDEDGRSISYGRLALDARRVAGALIAHGVDSGDFVIVTLPKGAAQVAAVLGVLAAGAAYVPVGIDQPTVRRQRIHALSGAGLAITDDEHVELVEDAGGVKVLPLNAVLRSERGPVRGARAEDPAYLLFTSGSTGAPKGVEVPHRAAVSTIDALADLFGTGRDDATIALSALEFDLSVYDLFAPLSVGGRVVMVGEQWRRDAARWVEAVQAHQVTVVNCVPAMLDLLLAAATDAGHTGPLPSLRLTLLGGDWVGLDQPARLRELAPRCRFVALGGMTEAAIHSTVFEVAEGQVDPAWRSMPYGVPLRNVRARVVDERGHDRAALVPGELWIGGRGLANGYRGDPERTAARFVTDRGERWYRSGDMARYLSDGTLEFLGRADQQVKIRGHRIELGEVEAALREHPGVLRAVAAVTAGPAGPRLGAVVSADTDADLHAWAAERLPPSMRPDRLLVVAELPLTSNGKLDRNAARALLETAERGDDGATRRAPVGETERTVADLWVALLKRADEVSRDDSFFALGGDSLVATRLVARLRALGFAASVADLFAAPVLADFAARLEPAAVPAPAARTIDQNRALIYEPFPLTEVQAAYLTGRGSGFTLGGVGTWHYTEFDGSRVDLERLAGAWRGLVRRHGMLRAVIRDGAQRVLPEAELSEFRIQTEDVRNAPTETAREALDALRETMSHQIRDLATWPLFDIRAVHYRDDAGTDRTRIGVGLDYTVLDALSIVTLYTEWAALYANGVDETALAPLGLSYRDYQTACSARAEADPSAAEATRDHWRARVDALPDVPRLPLRVDPAEVAAPRFTRRRTALDADSWQRIKTRAAAHGLTPSAVLLAAYGEVLATWSGTEEVALTLTLFNRDEIHPDVHRVVGDFTALSLFGYRRAAEAWLPGLRAVQRRLAEDLDHQDVSAGWLLRESARRQGGGESGVAVVFTSALAAGDTAPETATGFPERIWGLTQTPQVCLDQQVTEESGALVVSWDAVEELFRTGVLDAMVAAHARLLDHLARNEWSEPVPYLLPLGRHSARAELNSAPPAAARVLHEGFFAHAAREPGRVALIAADGRTLSYGETADAALRTAEALRARGVRDGDLVAVCLPKGPEQIVAVLGVLAAGAAYVPIGVEQPSARREAVQRAAGIRVAIGTGAHAVGAAAILTPDQAAHRLPASGPRSVDPSALAYVIFTSGSTGEPNGVRISHAAAWNTLADVLARHGISAPDRVLALSALDFDLSVFDIFGLLAVGGALVLPSEEQRREPQGWRELVREHGVTVWNTVPALLDLLLSADERGEDPGALDRLGTVLISGDWVGLDLPARLRARTGGRCRFTALGGATEASVWSNAFDATDADLADGWLSVPYGFPLAGQRYRVVDGGGRDCPEWVAGELWIGGAGVADGYLADARRTAEKFVTVTGERWYRTGDLGRYRPGGLLEFLGRTDHQLKIAGHRIEAGEVEAALEAHPAVARAAVVAVGPRAARRLAAFVVPASTHGAPGYQQPELRPWLAERLAPYAIPGVIEALPQLPLTANGKVDRQALARRAEQASDPGVASSADAAPRDGLETALAELWSTLLSCPVHDRSANFFTLGGDSLAAIRLAAAIERDLGIRIPVRRLLAAPTLAALADELAARGAAAGNRTESGEL